MYSSWLKVPLAAALVSLAALGGRFSQATETVSVREYGMAADTPSVLDGVYTVAQAEAGSEVYERVCTRCHTIGDFQSEGLHSLTVKFPDLGEMFTRISTRMPLDDPGSLSAAEYASVVAYILHQNGYPAGQAELAAEGEKLKPIQIVPLSTRGR